MKPRRIHPTKFAATVLAPLALAGAIATPLVATQAASAKTPAQARGIQVKSPLLSRGFDVTNNSDATMVLDSIIGTDWDGSRPAPGTRVKPGQTIHFELTYHFAREDFGTALFVPVLPNGKAASGQVVDAEFGISNDFGGTAEVYGNTWGSGHLDITPHAYPFTQYNVGQSQLTITGQV